MILADIYSLPGGNALSKDFCNLPVSVEQSWVSEPVAAILLCGRLRNHEGNCDPAPPMSDVMFKEN